MTKDDPKRAAANIQLEWAVERLGEWDALAAEFVGTFDDLDKLISGGAKIADEIENAEKVGVNDAMTALEYLANAVKSARRRMEEIAGSLSEAKNA